VAQTHVISVFMAVTSHLFVIANFAIGG